VRAVAVFGRQAISSADDTSPSWFSCTSARLLALNSTGRVTSWKITAKEKRRMPTSSRLTPPTWNPGAKSSPAMMKIQERLVPMLASGKIAVRNLSGA
jgi:hypothetical protein